MAEAQKGAERIVLARLRRPWGRHGESILELHTDWPEQRFAPGTTVRLRWDDGRETERVVAGFRELNQGAMLALEGVTDIGTARDLAGAWIVADAATLPSLAGPDEWRQADLVGLRVELPDGRAVGRVTGIEEAQHADLVRVALDGGREALVPLAPAICLAVDLEGGRIVIDPPVGLLDLDQAEQA